MIKNPGSRRREELLDAAETVFAADGFEKATVRRVADAAGILSGSLYHHFHSKGQMAVEVLDRFMSEMLRRYRKAASLGHSPDQTLGEFIEIAVQGIADHHGGAIIMHNDWPALQSTDDFPRVEVLASEIEHEWVRVIEEGVARGRLRQGIDPRVGYRAMVGGVLSTVRWYRPTGPLDIRTIATQYESLFLAGYRDGCP